MTRSRFKVVGIVVVALVATAALAVTIGNLELPRFRVSGGGDEAITGGDFTLGATIGQAEATGPDELTGGDYSLTGGFRVVGASAGAICAGDTNGDGVVDVLDIIELFTFWGPCPGCPADLNMDGVVDVGDLLILLADWNCGASDSATFDETLAQAGLSREDWDGFVDVVRTEADADTENLRCWMKRSLQTLTEEWESGPLEDCPGENPLGG